MLVAFYCLRHSPPQLLIMQYISRFRFSAAIAAKCTLPDLKCKKGGFRRPDSSIFLYSPRPIAGDGVPDVPLSVGRDPCVPPQDTAFVPAGHTGPGHVFS